MTEEIYIHQKRPIQIKRDLRKRPATCLKTFVWYLRHTKNVQRNLNKPKETRKRELQKRLTQETYKRDLERDLRSLSLSLSLCLCLCLCLCPCLCLCMSLSLSVSPSPFLSLSLPRARALSLTLYLPLPPLSLSLSHARALSLSLYLSNDAPSHTENALHYIDIGLQKLHMTLHRNICTTFWQPRFHWAMARQIILRMPCII